MSEGVEKGLPAPNLTACSISGYSQARRIGLTGPADHSVLGSIQNAPDTSAKHYKEPADNSAFFPVKVSEQQAVAEGAAPRKRQGAS